MKAHIFFHYQHEVSKPKNMLSLESINENVTTFCNPGLQSEESVTVACKLYIKLFFSCLKFQNLDFLSDDTHNVKKTFICKNGTMQLLKRLYHHAMCHT